MPRIDTASRRIHAGPDVVYSAWVDPQALVRWLPPTGMTGRIDAFDPREGGFYAMTLTYDDPSIAGKGGDGTDTVHGRFTRLVPGELIETEADFDSPDPAFAGTMTMAWTLTAVGADTEVTVTCTGVPDGISQEDHIEGITASLQNLAEFLGG